VLSELRYVDHRFAPRVGRRVMIVFAACLAAIVLARVALAAGAVPAWAAITVELVLDAAMAAAVLPLVGPHPLRRSAVGAAVFLLLAMAWRLPFEMLAILAVAHNVTPVAFLAEALPAGAARRRMLRLAGLVFVALPALIASGLPQAWLHGAGLFAPDLAAFDVGPLVLHLGAYLPAALQDAPWAVAAFSAAVFAQLMHYAAVIGWMPRLIAPASGGAALPWPRARVFWAAVAGAGAAMLALFAVDWTTARLAYSLAAAVHASVEIPLIALALAGLGGGQPVVDQPGGEGRAVAQPG
jgi:hypothetical protein